MRSAPAPEDAALSADGPSGQWTVGQALRWVTQRLQDSADNHLPEAGPWLVAWAGGFDRSILPLHIDQELSPEQQSALQQAVQRRLSGEPLQYITGQTSFRRLDLSVRPGVLIPRPETELLVELVLSARPHRVLEIGCGSGAICLSLLQELPDVIVVATDISAAAIQLTAENARSLQLEATGRLSLYQDDLASQLLDQPEQHQSFDVLVSNPPYIPSARLAELAREVRDFEPRPALDGGADGLVVFRQLLQQALWLLRPAGLLAVELYETQLELAEQEAEAAGFHATKISPDLAGRPRFLTAQRP